MADKTAKYTHKQSVFDRITDGMSAEEKKVILGAFKVLTAPDSARASLSPSSNKAKSKQLEK